MFALGLPTIPISEPRVHFYEYPHGCTLKLEIQTLHLTLTFN